MKSIFLVLIVLVAGIFNSCTTDFEVNAEWKEIGIAYFLIDKKDSVQYLKLNKAYLNDDANANEIALIEDSLYFSDEDIEVTLFAGQEKVSMHRVKLSNKEDGVFAGPDQYVYRTPVGYVISETRQHRLVVQNVRTGYTMSSQIKIVKDGTINSPFQGIQKLALAGCDIEDNLSFYIDRSMEVVSGKDVKFYDFDIVFHFEEYNKTTEVTEEKSLLWPIARTLKASTSSGGATLNTRVRGEGFFNYLDLKLKPVADDVIRIPGEIEFQFHAGGQEIYDYINVNTPSIGIVQKKPEYTNLENGLGIFSSRTTQTVSFELDRCTKLQLAKGEKTGHLGFVR